MSKIRSRNTKVENLIFRELRKRNIYFKKHYKNAIGNPDIALPRKKKAVFIDGDFWHGYQFIKLKKRLPKKYWIKKIESTIIRDRKVDRELRRMGWRVFRFWEHEIKLKPEKTIEKIVKMMI